MNNLDKNELKISQTLYALFSVAITLFIALIFTLPSYKTSDNRAYQLDIYNDHVILYDQTHIVGYIPYDSCNVLFEIIEKNNE